MCIKGGICGWFMDYWKDQGIKRLIQEIITYLKVKKRHIGIHCVIGDGMVHQMGII